jgi:hypothetical protein
MASNHQGRGVPLRRTSFVLLSACFLAGCPGLMATPDRASVRAFHPVSPLYRGPLTARCECAYREAIGGYTLGRLSALKRAADSRYGMLLAPATSPRTASCRASAPCRCPCCGAETRPCTHGAAVRLVPVGDRNGRESN